MTRPKEQKQGSIEQGSLFNSKIKVNEQNKKILLLAPLKPIKAQINSCKALPVAAVTVLRPWVLK